MSVYSTLFAPRLGRAGGTTDADLRACTSFALCRPGWSVEEVTAHREETFLLLTDGAGGAWRIARVGGSLLVADVAAQGVPRKAATVGDGLALIAQADTGIPIAA